MSVEDNLEKIYEKIANAARRAGRNSADVTLVAVTKTRSLPEIRAAHAAGIKNFGENRIQEAQEKVPFLRSEFTATWHMIGHLQRNKVKYAVEMFDMIHSVDSERLVREIDKRCAQAERVMPILLEVNVSGEESKYGLTPATVKQVVEVAVDLPHVELRGLMTMAPLVADTEEVRPVFQRLRELRDELAQQYATANWQHLSMGMTDDFEVAVEEGATIVRIGRAIFESGHV